MMSENSNENRVQNTDNTEEDNTLNPKKYYFDMSSLMNLDDTGSIQDLTPILLNTDSVINNKIDPGKVNQIPLLNQDQLQEKLVLILEQIEKSNQDLAELKDQLAQLKEQHQKFVKFFY
jgi:hypothetical protein